MADFGLAEDIYTNNYYQWKRGDTAVKLPVKWMSLESIQDCICTERSDVVRLAELTYIFHVGRNQTTSTYIAGLWTNFYH